MRTETEKTEKTDRPKAVSSGALAAFPGAPECHVLSNGRRVITQRGIIRCLTAKNEDGSGGVRTGILERYLGGLPNDNRKFNVEQHSVEFDHPEGGPAIGWDAESFVDICLAYIDASEAGLLRPNQEHLAARSRQVVRALAKTGIVALIDEATGYQVSREVNELNKLYQRILRDTPQKWERLFDKKFQHEIETIHNKPHKAGFPGWIRELIGRIYDGVLGKPIMGEVRRRNPNPSHRNNHHQHFQDPVRAFIKNRANIVEAIAMTSSNKNEFNKRVNHYLKKHGLQLDLDLEDGEG